MLKTVKLALATFILAATPLVTFAATPFKVAFTVDDLPSHAQLPAGTMRTEVAKAFLDSFAEHKVPGVYGFVNAHWVKNDPSSLEVLKMWRAAGQPLGNHGYTHMNRNAGTYDDFIGDLEGNEPLLAELMPDADWRVLRFPFLSAGKPDRHDRIMQWLKAHSYRTAEVTISFNDWAYGDVHARCTAKGDQAAIDKMKARYLSDAVAELRRERALSQAVYGREIPHVVLMHIGGFSALMLPEVLKAYEAEGAQFITLDEAQKDAAYTGAVEPIGEGLMIERAAAAKGTDLSGIVTGGTGVADILQLCQ